MRTDFREERKWKLALAYSLAHAVVEWHEAGSAEERIKRGICMSWRRPRPEDVDCDEVVEKVQDLFEPGTGDEDSKGNSTPANDEGSDDDSDEDETQDVLNASAVLQDALVEDAFTAQLGSISASISQQDVRPKLEFVEDRSALSVAQTSISSGPSGMQVDSQPRTKDKDAKEDPRSSQKDVSKPDEPRGLKATSHNPVFGAVAGPSHSNNKVPNSKTKSSRSTAYAHLREEIVYSDLNKLFIDLDDFDLVKGMSELSTEDPTLNASLPPPDLASIFPDLQPYTLLDVAPAPGSDGKRKSDRRGDRDDPNKRAEDTTYSKLVPTNEFMLQKSTFVGALRPSKHWSYAEQRWRDLDETTVIAEFSSPTSRPVDETAHSSEALFLSAYSSIILKFL